MVRKRQALRVAPQARAKVLGGPLRDPLYEAARALLAGKPFEIVEPCTCAACRRDGQHEPFCGVHEGASCGCSLARN